MRRFTPIAVLFALSTLAAAQAPTNTSGPLVVPRVGHVHLGRRQDGKAVDWLPLSGPPAMSPYEL